MDRFVRVGQIAGAFGLKGHVKIQPLTDYPAERFVKGARLRIDGEWIEVESATVHKGRPLLKLKGVDSMTAAETLRFKYIETADELVLEKDEFLVTDLIGLSVRTDEGEDLGKVERVLPNPAHEILVVGEIMIPLVEHFVKDVDVERKQITVRLIPGMRPGEL